MILKMITLINLDHLIRRDVITVTIYCFGLSRFIIEVFIGTCFVEYLPVT